MAQDLFLIRFYKMETADILIADVFKKQKNNMEERSMKKSKMLSVMIMGISLLLLFGCGQDLGDEFTEEVNTLEGAALVVDENAVTSTGITYTMENQTDRDLNYGQDYGLQQEKDGRWYQVTPKEPVAVTLELLWLPAGSSDTLELSWESSYGKLASGHYRIVKNVSDNEGGYYLAGEFEIK